jgi:hypothetical protein
MKIIPFKLNVTTPSEILNNVCNTTIVVATMLVIIFMSFCKDDVVPKTTQMGTTKYFLENTKWKLVAFVDVRLYREFFTGEILFLLI